MNIQVPVCIVLFYNYRLMFTSEQPGRQQWIGGLMVIPGMLLTGFKQSTGSGAGGSIKIKDKGL